MTSAKAVGLSAHSATRRCNILLSVRSGSNENFAVCEVHGGVVGLREVFLVEQGANKVAFESELVLIIIAPDPESLPHHCGYGKCQRAGAKACDSVFPFARQPVNNSQQLKKPGATHRSRMSNSPR